MFAASPLRFYRISLALGVLVITTQALAADSGMAAPRTAQTRYVWATNLTVRAAPDSKSAEIVKLPFGSAVEMDVTNEAPVAHQESVLKLIPSADTTASEVTISGHWQHIHAGQNNGWVFDGFLSRYPTPPTSGANAPAPEGELEFAKHVFGVKLAQAWKDGDSRKSPEFVAMRKHTQVKDKEISGDLEWAYVEFQPQGSYEQFQNRPGDVLENTITFKNVPMTFNEAILWVRYFDAWYATDPQTHALMSKYSGKVQAGHHIEIKPSDDTVGVATNRIVDCKQDTCNLKFQLSD